MHLYLRKATIHRLGVQRIKPSAENLERFIFNVKKEMLARSYLFVQPRNPFSKLDGIWNCG